MNGVTPVDVDGGAVERRRDRRRRDHRVGPGLTRRATPTASRIPRTRPARRQPPAMARRRVSGFQAPVFRSSGLGRSPQAEQRGDTRPRSRAGSGARRGPTRPGREMTAAIPMRHATTTEKDSSEQGALLGAAPRCRRHTTTSTTTIPMSQGELVVGSEGRDREVLQPGGRPVDEGAGPQPEWVRACHRPVPSHTRRPASSVATPDRHGAGDDAVERRAPGRPGRRLLDALVGRSRRRATTERRRDSRSVASVLAGRGLRSVIR